MGILEPLGALRMEGLGFRAYMDPSGKGPINGTPTSQGLEFRGAATCFNLLGQISPVEFRVWGQRIPGVIA